MNKILIIGSGGREHSLAWKLAQSPQVDKIYIAPGNAGTAAIGENVPITAADIEGLLNFAKKSEINLTVVGPDDSLAQGVVDVFQKNGLKIWGPTQQAAKIESSKSFAKNLMTRMNIPTAEYKVFTNYNEAVNYIQNKKMPLVIKASGLALGKGVTVCDNREQAQAALKLAMVDRIFGESGNEVIVEEFLDGLEFSAHAFSDGNNFSLFPAAQDHKRIYDGDLGPNTGGMGTVTPLAWINEDIMNEVSEKIVKPVLEGLNSMGHPFVGLLYPGLMMTSSGPKVVEFNARLGDPECQSYMRLLKTDLYEILEGCLDGKLSNLDIVWENKYACCVVLASGGYPGKYEKGKLITGINEAEKINDVIIFQAGTSLKDNELVSNGGRVLGVTAVASDLQAALNKTYEAIKLIKFDGMHFRTDIGQKTLLQKNN